MGFFDLPLDELRAYSPHLSEPDDLDEFWSSTLAETRVHDLDVVVEPVPTPLRLVDSYDVSFRGFGGQRIRAWLHVPAGTARAIPAVVEFHGYTGGRGHVHQNVVWALAGYAQLTVDTRGQGWGGPQGSTPDRDPDGNPVAAAGHVTRGILDPRTYYYRRVYADAVRAVEAAREIALIDGSRVVVAGMSQGGGIAIAAAALADGVLGAMVNVPFLCHFERAVGMTESDPYQEIARYLQRNRDQVEAAFSTLQYFDGALLAARAAVPTLFSVALMDTVCPPSTVFAAYNRWGSADRDIAVYAFNGHEGGEEFHLARQYAWLEERMG